MLSKNQSYDLAVATRAHARRAAVAGIVAAIAGNV